MSDFTHSLFSHGNKALTIGDSKPLRYRGRFFLDILHFPLSEGTVDIRKSSIDI